MPTVNDVIVRKPTDEESAAAKSWPTWSAEASSFDWAYTQQETCLILEGKVTVSDKTASVEIGPGDYVIFPSDLDCTWKITQPIRKHYTFD